MNGNSSLHRELNFFNEVRERLESKTLYEEFLNCIDLYSQSFINDKELFKLVNSMLSQHPDLQQIFRQYIGIDEVDYSKGIFFVLVFVFCVYKKKNLDLQVLRKRKRKAGTRGNKMKKCLILTNQNIFFFFV